MEPFLTKFVKVFGSNCIGQHLYRCLGEVPKFYLYELLVDSITTIGPLKTRIQFRDESWDFREAGSQRREILREGVFNTDRLSDSFSLHLPVINPGAQLLKAFSEAAEVFS